MTLLPCPFCGSLDVEARMVSNNEGSAVEVWCTECGAEGPEEHAGLLARDVKAKHTAAAKRSWNRRATPATGETKR